MIQEEGNAKHAREALKKTMSRIESGTHAHEITPKELERMMRVTGSDTLP
jgi:hypothetical protein